MKFVVEIKGFKMKLGNDFLRIAANGHRKCTTKIEISKKTFYQGLGVRG